MPEIAVAAGDFHEGRTAFALTKIPLLWLYR